MLEEDDNSAGIMNSAPTAKTSQDVTPAVHSTVEADQSTQAATAAKTPLEREQRVLDEEAHETEEKEMNSGVLTGGDAEVRFNGVQEKLREEGERLERKAEISRNKIKINEKLSSHCESHIIYHTAYSTLKALHNHLSCRHWP